LHTVAGRPELLDKTSVSEAIQEAQNARSPTAAPAAERVLNRAIAEARRERGWR
jgi:hypothetical protein